MHFSAAIEDLQKIFADCRSAASGFLARKRMPAARLLAGEHLPLLLLFPVFSAMSPLRWWLHGGLSVKKDLLYPLAAPCAFLMLAAVYDRILEYSRSPSDRIESDRQNQLSLFLFLPVAASGMFFLIHPAVGFAAVIFSGIYSSVQTIQIQSELRGLSPARGAAYFFSAAAFLLIPVNLVLFLMNLMRSIDIVIDLF